MGQIKNIKLHIVTDIKLSNSTLSLQAPAKMADKMTPEQREEFQQAFDVFKDDHGNIPNEKLYSIMKSLGQNVPDVELQMMIQDVDTDDSGEIDIDEFMAMMASHPGLVEPDDSREAFKCLDSATEGQVKTEDLREILNGFKDTLSEDQINNLFLELDPDNVGKVDFRRYKKVFCF